MIVLQIIVIFCECLRVQQDQTALGVIGQGIGEFGQELQDYSGQFDQSLNQLNSKLEDSQYVQLQLSASQINQQIYDNQNRVFDIKQNLGGIQTQLAYLRETCNQHSTCQECVLDMQCGWCNEYCVQGDEFSDSLGQCEQYSYGTCPIQSCDQHQTCNTCIFSECLWCLQGNYCSSDGQTCQSAFLYRRDSTCPLEEDENNVDLQEFLHDSIEAKIRYQIHQSLLNIDRINEQIDSLDQQRSDILETVIEGAQTQIDPIQMSNYIGDVSSQLDQLSQNQTEIFNNQFEEYLQGREDDLNENQSISQMFQEIIEAGDQVTEQISEAIDDQSIQFDSTLTQQTQEIMQNSNQYNEEALDVINDPQFGQAVLQTTGIERLLELGAGLIVPEPSTDLQITQQEPTEDEYMQIGYRDQIDTSPQASARRIFRPSSSRPLAQVPALSQNPDDPFDNDSIRYMLEEDIDTTQEETDIDEQSDSTFVDSARFAITETQEEEEEEQQEEQEINLIRSFSNIEQIPADGLTELEQSVQEDIVNAIEMNMEMRYYQSRLDLFQEQIIHDQGAEEALMEDLEGYQETVYEIQELLQDEDDLSSKLEHDRFDRERINDEDEYRNDELLLFDLDDV